VQRVHGCGLRLTLAANYDVILSVSCSPNLMRKVERENLFEVQLKLNKQTVD